VYLLFTMSVLVISDRRSRGFTSSLGIFYTAYDLIMQLGQVI
jgi:hypothetical protein